MTRLNPPLPLHTLHREVHRFRGVVDRFGSFPEGGSTVHTLCIRQLLHARSNRLVLPEHWWFRLREGWTMNGLQPGDQVMFTTKVQRCTKGWDATGRPIPGDRRGRRQVIGLGDRVRDVVVTRRAVQRAPLDLLHGEIKALRQQLANAQQGPVLWVVQGGPSPVFPEAGTNEGDDLPTQGSSSQVPSESAAKRG